MEHLDLILWPPTVWHWLALGFILLSIEMAVGTYDLLWIAIAAGFTSAFAAFAPDALTHWQGQMVFFAAASAVLFVAGRTVFRNMRENVEEHPTLNKRMASLVGARGLTKSGFSGGMGRVRLGDTDWSAEMIDGSDPESGVAVVVEATDGNRLKVRRA